MFPPKKTVEITEWIQNLFSSLVRAGLDMNWDLELKEEGDVADVRIQLKAPVPKSGWAVFRQYVHQYSMVSGWRVGNLRQTGRFLTFRASRD